MAYCLDPDARVTYSRVVDVGVAMGVPKIKAVQALSELLRSDELKEVIDQDRMEIRIVMGKEARP